MNTREEHAVLALCLLTMTTLARAATADLRTEQVAATANQRCAALGAELHRVTQTLGAVAQAHGGTLEVSEHLLDRGPWDVVLTVDPVNHRHYVNARRR